MRHVAVFPNPTRDHSLAVTGRIVQFLSMHGICAVLPDDCELPFAPSGGAAPVYSTHPLGDPRVEAAFAIGGDGTLLAAAHGMAGHFVPLVGVGCGTLSFLPEVDPDTLDDHLEKWLAGTFTLEERMLLTCSRGAQSQPVPYALNDIVITRNQELQLLHLVLAVDGEALFDCRADGLIVATPTGSTAYALSAGGPLISPRAHCMAAVPICAHALALRPVVLPDDASLTVTCLSGTAHISLDGRDGGTLAANEPLAITRYAKTLQFVRFTPQSFYKRLRDKLSAIPHQ